MKRIKGLGQRGDTLVEVLICILIVSMVLTGAYVTTNKSSLRVIDSQERAEGLKIAQGQLEQVRESATLATTNVFDQTIGDAFCMVDNQIKDASLAVCKQDESGAPTTEEPAFAISTVRQVCVGASLPANCSLFTVTVRWESIATKTTAFQTLTYRLYE